MMPLTMMRTGEEATIVKVSGKEETRKFLETLGFVKGSVIQMVTSMNGNVIVNIKESRIAISKEMANKIMI